MAGPVLVYLDVAVGQQQRGDQTSTGELGHQWLQLRQQQHGAPRDGGCGDVADES